MWSITSAPNVRISAFSEKSTLAHFPPEKRSNEEERRQTQTSLELDNQNANLENTQKT